MWHHCLLPFWSVPQRVNRAKSATTIWRTAGSQYSKCHPLCSPWHCNKWSVGWLFWETFLIYGCLILLPYQTVSLHSQLSIVDMRMIKVAISPTERWDRTFYLYPTDFLNFGGIGKCATSFFKRLASLLSDKSEISYNKTIELDD